ncbi:MAG: hypothetical protein MAG453_01606 [Calditrichaeota bacterium]|nr:hypothetical protein [Calditrichota bacterium]
MFLPFPQFPYGRWGMYGGGAGYGRVQEPDMLSTLMHPDDDQLRDDVLNSLPASDDKQEIRDELEGLYTTYGGQSGSWSVVNTGAYCPDENTSYDMRVLSHEVALNGTDYTHYVLAKMPVGFDPQNPGANPVIVVCHGNILSLTLEWFNNWMAWVNSGLVAEHALVMLPLLFSTERDLELLQLLQADYHDGYQACPGRLIIDEGEVGTIYRSDNISASGVSEDEANIAAVLQMLDIATAFTTSREVAFFGSSKGARVAYHAAYSASFGDPNQDEMKTALAIICYGGTDWYQDYAVREYRRYLRSKYGILNSTYPDGYYDGQDEQGRRIYTTFPTLRRRQAIPLENHILDPGNHPRETTRKFYTYSSIAEWWDYSTPFPYAMQVHHGSHDTVVWVGESRWLARRMRQENVTTDDFTYHETHGGPHSFTQLTSNDAARELIENTLTWP